MKQHQKHAAGIITAVFMAGCLTFSLPATAQEPIPEDTFQDIFDDSFSSGEEAAAPSDPQLAADAAAPETPVDPAIPPVSETEVTAMDENEADILSSEPSGDDFQSAAPDALSSPETAEADAEAEADSDTDTQATATEGYCTEQIRWEVTPEGELILTGTGEMCDYTAASPAPWQALRHMIRTVTVGKEITRIGAFAFEGMAELESLRLDLSRTKLDTYALTGCKASLEILVL